MLKLQNLREWEQLEVVVKMHRIIYVIIWFYLLLWIILTTVLFMILTINMFVLMLIIIFWMIFSMFLFIEWLNHELDLFIVTNNRIIWVEQISFLNRTVSECNLWQVQEVNSRTSWIFSNILNYGTILIQTAWNRTTLKMDFAPDSMQAARKILNVVDTYRNNNKTK